MEYLIKEIDDLPINDDPFTSEEIQLNIIINNITSGFETGCKIDLKKIPEKYTTKPTSRQTATFKVDDCTIVIRNSGKLLCMGASSEDQAISSAKKSVEILRSWGFKATFSNYKIFTVFCTCLMPWRVKLEQMVTKYQDLFVYESEIHNCCVLKLNKKQGSLGVYSTGTVRIVGHTTEMVVDILEKVLPYFSEFRI